jgi:uncharacterized membrane protein
LYKGLSAVALQRRLPAWFSMVTWAYIVASLVLGTFVPRVTVGPLAWVNPVLGPDQVIAFLSALSTGMMTFTGIVFSLLFILMQFGSSAYSPHLVTTLARNRVLVHAQGVFTGTFLYALMALRGVGSIGEGGTAGLTVWVAFAWLIASVYLLMRLVGVFSTLNISDVLDMLGETGRREIRRVYPPDSNGLPVTVALAAPVAQILVHRGSPRYVLRLDVERLVSLATAANALIRVSVSIGDPVTTGTTILMVEGPAAIVPEGRLHEAIALGRDRTLEAGPKQAMRLLVDIGIRALSPAVNDPTTAVRSLDQIEDLLVRLGNSRLDIGSVADASGVVRLEYPVPTWDEYLELGVTEIQQYGAASVQIERRLAALLSLLRKSLPPARQLAVERMAHERIAVVRSAFAQEWLRLRAERLDRQGLGHTTLGA